MNRLLTIIAALFAFLPAVAQDHSGAHDHGPAWFHRLDVEVSYADRKGGVVEWDVHGWIGGDAERVWLRSQGAIEDGRADHSEAELFYGWNVDDFWDLLVGVRHDFEPDGRTFAAAGLVGMLPYFLETEATLYVSEDGDVSARLEQHIDLRLTQRLVLEPSWELNMVAQDDVARGIGAGLAEIEAAVQLRYEIEREIAPFVEIAWERKLGETALIARAAGDDVEETSVHIGLSLRF